MKAWLKSYNMPTIARALVFMGRRKYLFLAMIFGFCAVEVIASILYTTGMRDFIDALGGIDVYGLGRAMVWIVLCNLIWWIYAPFSAYGCAWASKGAVQRFRANLAERVIRLPMSEHDRRDRGAFLSAFTSDIKSLEDIYDQYLYQVCRTSLCGAAGVGIMAAVDWRFAIVVLSLGMLSVFLASRSNRHLEDNSAKLQACLARSSAALYELIRGAKTIRLFHLIRQMEAKVHACTQSEVDASVACGRENARMKVSLAAVSVLTYAAMLCAGALFVHLGWSRWSTVVPLIALKQMTTDLLFIEFGSYIAGMQTCVAGVKRLLALRALPCEGDHAPPHVSIAPSPCALSLRGVCFSYGDQRVLRNFCMDVTSRGLTVLLGASGTGKSTIMKLMLGLYAPQDGEIIFDGREPCTLSNIRAKTAYVPQDPMLIRGSLLDNIAFGNHRASREELLCAAEHAGADGFILETASGYDTVLADGGMNLSGGQRQRIAIARALVSRAQILLLDEITSALDTQTEIQVLETLRKIAQTKAVVFITHKQSVCAVADAVYRLPS